MAMLVSHTAGMIGASGKLIGKDFSIFYAASALLQEKGAAALHTPSEYILTYKSMFGQVEGQRWPYPPHTSFVIAPLSWFSYNSAWLLWAATGLGMMLASAWHCHLRPQAMVFLCASPAVILALYYGQSSMLASACIVGGFVWRQTRPVLAGICFGLATIKPQLGLLVPVLLLAERNYRCIGIASITFFALAMASLILWGWQAWYNFLFMSLPAQRTLLESSLYASPSIFMAARQLGADVAVAYGAQILMSLMAVFLFYRLAVNQSALLVLSFALLLPLSTPYSFIYDMPLLALAVILYLQQRGYTTDKKTSAWLLLLWFSPILVLVDYNLHLPLTACLFVASAVYLYRQDSLKPHSARRADAA